MGLPHLQGADAEGRDMGLQTCCVGGVCLLLFLPLGIVVMVFMSAGVLGKCITYQESGSAVELIEVNSGGTNNKMCKITKVTFVGPDGSQRLCGDLFDGEDCYDVLADLSSGSERKCQWNDGPEPNCHGARMASSNHTMGLVCVIISSCMGCCMLCGGFMCLNMEPETKLHVAPTESIGAGINLKEATGNAAWEAAPELEDVNGEAQALDEALSNPAPVSCSTRHEGFEGRETMEKKWIRLPTAKLIENELKDGGRAVLGCIILFGIFCSWVPVVLFIAAANVLPMCENYESFTLWFKLYALLPISVAITGQILITFLAKCQNGKMFKCGLRLQALSGLTIIGLTIWGWQEYSTSTDTNCVNPEDGINPRTLALFCLAGASVGGPCCICKIIIKLKDPNMRPNNTIR